MIVTLLMVGALSPDLATLNHAALVSATHSIANDRAIADDQTTGKNQIRVAASLVGTSRGGRSIEALTLEPEGASSDRPAVLLVAGLSGDEAFSSTLALHHAQALAEGYGSDEAVTALLDACTVHVIPRVNPDAIEAFFESPKREREATGRGVDDDRDGVQGEDPLQDVDGDGMVTWMRYLDPEGDWIQDATDARVLVKPDREKLERGAWILTREARDLDGDELTGEDGPHNAIVNRNFPAGWEEHQADVGLWPTDEPEVRGLVDFVLAHRNLVLVVAYDGQGNMVKLPTSVADDAPAKQRIPAVGIRATDLEQLKRIAKSYVDLTDSKVEGESEGAGSFQRWAYEHRGLMVLSAKPWELSGGEEEAAQDEEKASADAETQEPANDAMDSEAQETEAEGAEAMDSAVEEPDSADSAPEQQPEPSLDAKRLAWIDAHSEESWRFDPWTNFEHPELGRVEIGGFTPLALTEPPAAARPQLAAEHLQWFLGLADEFPHLVISRFEKKRLGQGLFQVELVLENTGHAPLLSRAARLTRTIRPARVSLVLPDTAQLVAGASQQLVSDLAPLDGRFEATWLVQAKDADSIGIEIDTDHAGDLTKIAEVQQ